MIATNVRRLGLYLMLSFGVVTASITWWQVIEAQNLAIQAGQPGGHRGAADPAAGDHLGHARASSSRARRWSTASAGGPTRIRPSPTSSATPAFDSAAPASSARTRTCWSARPIRTRCATSSTTSSTASRMPRDLSLTIDQRLQDFAAAQLGGDAGAVVALDPNTGAVLALVSTPTFDATPISGDPGDAQKAMDALRDDPAEPLLGRARQGLYVPGSIMKVFTASSALDAGVITPSTTFPDQPAQEVDGFVVDGFTIREHDLGGHPAGPVGAVRGAPGVEQHLLRARRPRARCRRVPRLRPTLRLLRADGHRATGPGARRGAQLRHRAPSIGTAGRSATTSSSRARPSARA